MLTFCIYCISRGYVWAQQPSELPAISNKMFNDFVGLIEAPDAQFIENQLRILDNNAHIQIAIVIIEDIASYEISDYAVALGRKWGIGKNNLGLLILIAKNNRKIWFATGSRMEQYLPDITCKHIIQTDIKPFFKEGKYYLGLQSALVQIVSTLNKSDDSDPKIKEFYTTFLEDIKNKNGVLRNANSSNSVDQISFFKGLGIFIFIIILVIIISKFRGGGGGGMFIGSGIGLGGSSRHGGGSGISFGGFGGGSFGGGGAGGSW